MSRSSIGAMPTSRRRGVPLASAKVIVRFIDPIATDGTEHIDYYGVFQHIHLVREGAGNLNHLARSHDDFASIELEAQRSAQYTRHLFVRVRVARDYAT